MAPQWFCNVSSSVSLTQVLAIAASFICVVWIDCQDPFSLLPPGVSGIILSFIPLGYFNHNQDCLLSYQMLHNLSDKNHLCLNLLIASQGLSAGMWPFSKITHPKSDVRKEVQEGFGDKTKTFNL